METCWEDRKLPVKKKALNTSVLFSLYFMNNY
jgi:hypothetical protein